MSEALVHIYNFRMDFDDKTVIRDLSFDVGRGETFGFLGSNGSGKTTTIRALLGIYQPTAGTLHIDGRPFRPEDGGRLGYLPEERGLYKKEKVIDVMTYFGRLKGLERHAARTWSLEYLERVALADKAGAQLDKLSGGQQQIRDHAWIPWLRPAQRPGVGDDGACPETARTTPSRRRPPSPHLCGEGGDESCATEEARTGLAGYNGMVCLPGGHSLRHGVQRDEKGPLPDL